MTADYSEAKPLDTLYPLNHLASISVSGDDALQFLQGQLTCNVKELTEAKASIAAFCNPKGRVISTLLIVKTASGFCLILPRSLLDKVLKKLQMYVLRAKVKLADESDTLILTGLSGNKAFGELTLPVEDFACSRAGDQILIKLPSTQARFLLITNANTDIKQLLAEFALGNETEWRYLDICSGLPWFELEQSEKHIPQMINIEQLGGISYNKGCYTGQEIIARTHYLGKAKRQLFLAECNRMLQADCDLSVKNAETGENVGEILGLQAFANNTRMLVVLQIVDGDGKNLILDDMQQTPLTLIPYQ